MVNPAHTQSDYAIRFDWGLPGAEAIAPGADVTVVVDVLSFTTTLSVAIDVGTSVVPWQTRDATAAEFARANDAVLAVGREAAKSGDVSLSPATLRAHAPRLLVLPSPNGSTIAARLAATGRDRNDGSSADSLCIGASLRNAPSVASWIAANTSSSAVVSVVAAGERWPAGALRPAVEDLWGAGYLIAELARHRPDGLSPEARMAARSWLATQATVSSSIADSASGRELRAAGFGVDVDIACEVGASSAVPILRDGRFSQAGT